MARSPRRWQVTSHNAFLRKADVRIVSLMAELHPEWRFSTSRFSDPHTAFSSREWPRHVPKFVTASEQMCQTRLDRYRRPLIRCAQPSTARMPL
jgi:hypothetical protein